ncbi:MAG: hypothetical protein JSU83_02800 [Deltaproteobacteria bacterium]|nr:MAG: hypothetical protein JSU83_02800 [Deltaproteobacteria bacterium]
MKANCPPTMNLRLAAWVFLLITLIAPAACLMNYGRLNPSQEITSAFKDGHMYPDYNYYSLSWSAGPYVIVGIQKDYTLSSESWMSMNLTETSLKHAAHRMDLRFGSNLQGSAILNVYGKQIGVWYSGIRWATVRIREDKKTVTLIPEIPELGGGL